MKIWQINNMCYNLGMDKNFKTRFVVGLSMFMVALVGLYTFDGMPFRVIYALFAIVAGVELMSFFRRRRNFNNTILAILEFGFLYCSILFVAQVDVVQFWYVILGVPGYDIFAYLFGKLWGGKIIKKSRPFPRISKNKTWEGTCLGLVMAMGMVTILMVMRGSFASEWFYLLCGPLALIGDLFESYLKRRFGVKDSNEIVIKYPAFKGLEALVGGSEGHGGFLDRVDSTAFATTILLIISSLG